MKATRTLLAGMTVTLLALSFSGFSHAATNSGQPGATPGKQNNNVPFVQPAQATLTAAQGIHLIVDGLKLSLAGIAFFKKPEATDYFALAKNDAWYATDLIVAAHNGFDLPADLQPDQVWTKEVFIHQLMLALEQHSNLPMINIVPKDFSDQDQVDPRYQGTIQRAIALGIATVDKDGKLHPKDALTQEDAAALIGHAVDYAKAHPGPADQSPIQKR
ncbi:S-layer homology domain-containing protein [Brevibacillus fluminis]|uniref:S-layer homology domain-containing protein n=1 Tax=Brevibacillus fluminis TaxID=511487 RepID=UPI003F892A2E